MISELKNALVLLLLLFSFQVFSQETATVLPKSIFRVREVTVLGFPVVNSYGNDGDLYPLLNAVNTTITAQQQAGQNAELNTLYTSLNKFQPGLGNSLFKTDVVANGTLEAKRYVVAAEYGLTEKISLGLIIPYTDLTINNNIGVVTTNRIEEIKTQVAGIQPLIDGLNTFKGKIPSSQTYMKQLFYDRGYLLPQRVQASGLGDTEIGAKYQFYNANDLMLATQTGFRLPTTTHQARPEYLLDQSTGDGQLDYALRVTLQKENIFVPNLALHASTNFTWQLPDTRHMPVRKNGDPMLPNLNDPSYWGDVRRDLGEMLEAELGTTYRVLNRTLAFFVDYDYTVKAQDSYSGGNPNFNYHYYEVNTRTESHRFEVGTTYSTIQAYREKKFIIPLEFKFSYSVPLAGVNIPDLSFARMDIILYF